MRKYLIAAVVVLVAMSASLAFARPIKVAVEYSPTSIMSYQGAIKVVNQLNDDTHFDFDATAVNGVDIDTIEKLNAYDAVVIGDGGDGGNDDLAVFSSALRSWVENGGGLVGCGWIIFENGVTTGNPNYDIDAVLPVNAIDYYQFYHNATQNITDQSHPVTMNVNDFFVGGCCIEFPSYPQVDPWGTILGSVNGNASVVVGQIGSGRSVYLGPAYTGASWYSNTIQAGDADRLLEQAVAWVAGPLYIEVAIDIKPGSSPNSVNLNGEGAIPVAIFGSDTFDVSAINAATVVLEAMPIKTAGKNNNLLAHFEDVNADGYVDMVVQIQDTDGVFQEGTSIATLTGYLYDGTPIQGQDEITVVP
ncbi:MAG: lacto-N-biose phosphorylase central domain-containing protein [bacterium]